MKKKSIPRGEPIYFVGKRLPGDNMHFCDEHRVPFEAQPGQWSSYMTPVEFSEDKARKEVQQIQKTGKLAMAWHAGWKNRGFQNGETQAGYLCGDPGTCFSTRVPEGVLVHEGIALSTPDIQLMTDQPPQCPECGTRVTILHGWETNKQVCRCLSCLYTFRLEADEDEDENEQHEDLIDTETKL